MDNRLTIQEINNEFSSNSELARALFQKSSLGEKKESKIVYSIYEVLYLIQIKKAELIKQSKNISFDELLKRYNKKDKRIEQKYKVFKDLKQKGYTLKAGLKFGVDFRCYEKGQKPGVNHAKYLVGIIEEKNKINPEDFCSKARIAHSTAKTLLLAIIDSEDDITYFEVNWKKP